MIPNDFSWWQLLIIFLIAAGLCVYLQRTLRWAKHAVSLALFCASPNAPRILKNPWSLMALSYTVFFLVSFLLSSRSTSGHAFQWKPFTPITISDDFLWWQPLAILFITAGLCIFLRKTLRWTWSYCLSIAVLWVLPIPTFFFCIRFYLCHLYQPPEGHYIIPQLPYWGWDFQTIGNRFVLANGIIFLVFAAYPVLLLWFNHNSVEKLRRLTWLVVLPLCFLLSVTPFLTMRVWVYGHIEDRVDTRCQEQLQEIHLALLRYAAEHDNRLPIAEDYQSLLPQIEPYLDQSGANPFWKRFDHCIIGNALDRPPKPFHWDASLSGKEIVRVTFWDYNDVLERHFGKSERTTPNRPAFFSGFGDAFIAGENWVVCPYIQTRHPATMRRTRPPEPFSAKDFQPEKFRVVEERREY